jgi:hypothetical protein
MLFSSEGIKHQKPSREIRRQANKTNPDNIIGPKVIHNAKYNMHIASNNRRIRTISSNDIGVLEAEYSDIART